MRADRWTDMMKLTVAFRNFANAPKNSISKTKPNYQFFFVLLTVHLSIILVINQLNAQILVL